MTKISATVLFFPLKWGNMSWSGSPDIPEGKQMFLDELLMS